MKEMSLLTEDSWTISFK